MSQPIEIFVVLTELLTVFGGQDDGFHTSRNGIGQNFICIIAPIGRQGFRGDSLNQVDSVFTIRSGTFCNNDSDWHTIRIHGQMYFGIEPPFVFDIA